MAKSSASRSEDVKTPLAIASFAQNLFEAREDKWGNKSYQVTLLFKKGTDLSALENAAMEAATAQWGEKAKNLIKEKIIKSPFLDGDGKQGKDGDGNPKPGFAGHTFIRCKSGADYKPKVFDKRRNPIMDKDGCPSGSQVYAVVNAFTWENEEQGKGMTFGVSLVQVVKAAEGDEVLGGGGGPSADKFFETIEDDGDAGSKPKDAGGLFS